MMKKNHEWKGLFVQRFRTQACTVEILSISNEGIDWKLDLRNGVHFKSTSFSTLSSAENWWLDDIKLLETSWGTCREFFLNLWLSRDQCQLYCAWICNHKRMFLSLKKKKYWKTSDCIQVDDAKFSTTNMRYPQVIAENEAATKNGSCIIQKKNKFVRNVGRTDTASYRELLFEEAVSLQHWLNAKLSNQLKLIQGVAFCDLDMLDLHKDSYLLMGDPNDLQHARRGGLPVNTSVEDICFWGNASLFLSSLRYRARTLNVMEILLCRSSLYYDKIELNLEDEVMKNGSVTRVYRLWVRFLDLKNTPIDSPKEGQSVAIPLKLSHLAEELKNMQADEAAVASFTEKGLNLLPYPPCEALYKKNEIIYVNETSVCKFHVDFHPDCYFCILRIDEKDSHPEIPSQKSMCFLKSNMLPLYENKTKATSLFLHTKDFACVSNKPLMISKDDTRLRFDQKLDLAFSELLLNEFVEEKTWRAISALCYCCDQNLFTCYRNIKEVDDGTVDLKMYGIKPSLLLSNSEVWVFLSPAFFSMETWTIRSDNALLVCNLSIPLSRLRHFQHVAICRMHVDAEMIQHPEVQVTSFALSIPSKFHRHILPLYCLLLSGDRE